jgi:2-oxo-4-hydroxy-4-carboxy-5-ureidoimidazoline decarboxylase
MPDRSQVTLAELNALPAVDAEPLFASCCGSSVWASQMTARRPFDEVSALLNAAEDTWWSLRPDDWREAFSHHPRIGERDAAVAQDGRARAWSAGEQRGVADANAEIRRAIAEGNREYERRFGHIYLVSAAGKTAPQLLAVLRSRLSNDPDTELGVAAGEQAKITRLRLLNLLGAAEGEVIAARRPPSAARAP